MIMGFFGNDLESVIKAVRFSAQLKQLSKESNKQVNLGDLNSLTPFSLVFDFVYSPMESPKTVSFWKSRWTVVNLMNLRSSSLQPLLPAAHK